ncbi:hypothetical protein Tco_1468849 [Tanacetum coccineum]
MVWWLPNAPIWWLCRGGGAWCEGGDDGAMMMNMVDRWWCWLSGDNGAMMMKMGDRWRGEEEMRWCRCWWQPWWQWWACRFGGSEWWDGSDVGWGWWPTVAAVGRNPAGRGCGAGKIIGERVCVCFGYIMKLKP